MVKGSSDGEYVAVLVLRALNYVTFFLLQPKCDAPQDDLPWEMPFTVVCATSPIVFYSCWILQ